jgi:hypothetical protein
MELWSKLRNLDAYPKVNEDFYSRTLSGGLITILSSLAILLLFFSEIRTYHSPSLFSPLTSSPQIHFNFALPSCGAALISPYHLAGFAYKSECIRMRNKSTLWCNEFCAFSYQWREFEATAIVKISGPVNMH